MSGQLSLVARSNDDCPCALAGSFVRVVRMNRTMQDVLCNENGICPGRCDNVANLTFDPVILGHVSDDFACLTNLGASFGPVACALSFRI